MIGSFSKTISASIRCGYIAARKDWIESLVDLKIATTFGGGRLAADVVLMSLTDSGYRQHLMRSLDTTQSAGIMQLWQEYEDANTPEAKAVKALDKLETILQHNQGINPPDFNYEFNLGYGQKHTSTEPLFALIRSILDEETNNKIKKQK